MKRALAFFICCCALAVGCGQGSAAPAATINGTSISTKDVVEELDAINSNQQYLQAIDTEFKQQGQSVVGATPGTYDAAFVAAVVRRQMQFALVHDEVVRRGLHADDICKQAAKNDLLQSLGASDVAQGQALYDSFPADYQARLRGWYEDEFALQADLAQQPCGSADVAKAYFDAHPDDFAQNCISLIAVNDQNLADSIVTEARAGADFATLAQQFSTDPQTAAAGGDAGCHTPDEFPSTIAPIVQGTAVGAVADPISNNQGGYVLIKINDRKPANFTDVGSRAEELAAQAQAVDFSAWLTKAQAASHVTVDPRYGTFDGSNFTINPPPLDSNAPSSNSGAPPASDSSTPDTAPGP